LIQESKLQSLLELSDEYCMSGLKALIERHLIRIVTEISTSKNLYGKSLTDRLDNLIELINLAGVYQLKKLKNECVQSIAVRFSKKQCEQSIHFASLDLDIRASIFGRRVDLLEEKLHQSELKLKQLNDVNLKQKFEIRHLEVSLNSK
jgi:hypothetical protein